MSDAPTISSLQNPLIRQVLKLRDNRLRKRERAVLVDGIREIERALDAGMVVRCIFLAEREMEISAVAHLAAKARPAVIPVSSTVLQKISFGQHHRDAVGWFEEPSTKLADLKLSATPLIVVLDGLEKPGNIGAIFRSADAVGVDAIILCESRCDRFNPSLIRASLGTVFTVACVQASRQETIRWVSEHHLFAVTARVDAMRTYWEIDYRQPLALVIGSEAMGLGEEWNNAAERIQSANRLTIDVRIPMQGAADSLNASVSAALLLFEAQRQRTIHYQP